MPDRRPRRDDSGGDRPRGDRPRGERGKGPYRRPADRPHSDHPRGHRPADRDNAPDRKWSRPPPFPRDDDRSRPRPPAGGRPRTGRPYQRADGPPPRPYEGGPADGPPRPLGRPPTPYGRSPTPHGRPPAYRGGPPADRDRPPAYRGAPPRPGRPFPGQSGPPAHAHRPPPRPVVDHSDLLGAEEELVAGRHPVEEAFAARRQAVRLLVVPERRTALDNLVIHATTLRIPVVEVEGGTLTSLAGFDGHQGVALVAQRRPAASVDDILARAHQRGQRPFVLVLDSLEDPQNLGTLLRSAEATGIHGVIYPDKRAAPLTAAAVKAAAGATEHLLLAPVADLAGTIADLRAHGLRAIGADQDAALSYAQADLRGPLVLVVGSEGFGISGQLRRRLDQTVRIPMRGKVASLNAAVAGSVLLFAAAEQRVDAPLTPEAGREQGIGTDESADLAAAPPDASPTAPDEPGMAAEPAAADLLPEDTPAPRPRRSRTPPKG